MRVAIPTNDKENIFKRTGRANGFLIADVANSDYTVKDYRPNTHSHHHHHGHDEHHEQGHSHKEIVNALSDCNYLNVNMIGKHFGSDLKPAGIKVFKTDKTSVKDAMDDFIKKNYLTCRI